MYICIKRLVLTGLTMRPRSPIPSIPSGDRESIVPHACLGQGAGFLVSTMKMRPINHATRARPSGRIVIHVGLFRPPIILKKIMKRQESQLVREAAGRSLSKQITGTWAVLKPGGSAKLPGPVKRPTTSTSAMPAYIKRRRRKKMWIRSSRQTSLLSINQSPTIVV